MKLFRIVTTYACAAVYINENDIIIDSAPIFKWAKGETIKGFISILKKQKNVYRASDDRKRREI